MKKRIIGLDYGSKTVGVAVSDPLGFTAQGLETITRKDENKLRKTYARIEALMEGNVRREDRKTYIDKMAAAFILQGYLDYQGFSENQAESEDSEDI